MVKKTTILSNASCIDDDTPNIKHDFWKIENNELIPNTETQMNFKSISSKKYLKKFGIYKDIIDSYFPIISEKGINQLISIVKPFNNLFHYFIIKDEDVGYSYIYTIRIKSITNQIIIIIDIMNCCDNLDSSQIVLEFDK